MLLPAQHFTWCTLYKLNKQGDNIQPWRTPFPIWNHILSIFPCPVLTVASWPAYRFFRRQAKWSSVPISLRIFQCVVIHTIKGFSIVNEAEVFLEYSCFFYDPTDIGNLISGSSDFSKSSLNIWRVSVHKLLKPGLENFEHYFASVWDEYNCVVVWIQCSKCSTFEHWTKKSIAFFGDWNEHNPSSPVATAAFSKFAVILSAALSQHHLFKIWNSSTGIPSPPLALFRVMLP